MRGVRWVRVTYCTPGGQPGGVAVESLEEGADLGFHWMGQTNTFSGMMGSCRPSPASGAMQARQGIRLGVLGSWAVRDTEIEVREE